VLTAEFDIFVSHQHYTFELPLIKHTFILLARLEEHGWETLRMMGMCCRGITHRDHWGTQGHGVTAPSGGYQRLLNTDIQLIYALSTIVTLKHSKIIDYYNKSELKCKYTLRRSSITNTPAVSSPLKWQFLLMNVTFRNTSIILRVNIKIVLPRAV